MADSQRVPVFELHIRPMFRLLDREHMFTVLHVVDLWSLTDVWQHRNAILMHVRDVQDMPVRDEGGPWPQEWINLFERWVATGSDTVPGHHLVLATPDANYQVQALGAGKRRLIADVTAPTDGCRVWFELQSISPGQREYTLYLEPTYPSAAAQPTPLEAVEDFVKGDATLLIVNDAQGRHQITLA